METATMGGGGWVVIPEAVRERLGLRPGSAVAFEVGADGRVSLVAAEGREGGTAALDPDRFRRLLGAAGPGMSTDEVLALTRPRD